MLRIKKNSQYINKLNQSFPKIRWFFFFSDYLVSLLRLHSSIIPGCSLRRYSVASAHIIFDVLTNNCNLAKKTGSILLKKRKNNFAHFGKFFCGSQRFTLMYQSYIIFSQRALNSTQFLARSVAFLTFWPEFSSKWPCPSGMTSFLQEFLNCF